MMNRVAFNRRKSASQAEWKSVADSSDRLAASAQKRTTLAVFLVLLLLALVLTLRMVLPFLLAVIMGGILALLAQPVFQWLKAHHFRPIIAAAVVTLGVILIVVTPISVFITKATQQGIAIGQALAEGGFSFRSLIDRMSGWGPAQALIGDPETFEEQVRRWVQSAGTAVTTAIIGVAAHLPKMILQLALASIACFFLLIDGRRFQSWMADKIPMEADVRTKVVDSFKNTAVSVIWATLAAASAQSAVIWLGYILLGIPAAFLAAGATFIFAWIPIVGSTPVWIAGAIYLYLQGASWEIVLMIAFGLIAGVVDNFVRPMVLKGRSKMHPLVSLVAIFGGISMFGIVGVFIGPILVAVLISLLQTWPAVGNRFGLLAGAISGAQTSGDDFLKIGAGKQGWSFCFNEEETRMARQSRITQFEQDAQARDRMAGESPAFLVSLERERKPLKVSEQVMRARQKSGLPVRSLEVFLGLLGLGFLAYLVARRQGVSADE